MLRAEQPPPPHKIEITESVEGSSSLENHLNRPWYMINTIIFRGDVSPPCISLVTKWRPIFVTNICKMSSFSFNLDHLSQMLLLHKGMSYTNKH